MASVGFDASYGQRVFSTANTNETEPPFFAYSFGRLRVIMREAIFFQADKIHNRPLQAFRSMNRRELNPASLSWGAALPTQRKVRKQMV